MANQEILAVTYGLASASFWGTSDFSGGFVTKTSSVFGVLLVANIAGTVLLTICALWVGSPIPDLYSLVFAGLAGIAGLTGLASFYKGLAIEHMGMVASLAAVISAALPVIFGMLIEGFPSHHQIVGFAIAFVAIWHLSVSEKSYKIRWRQLRFPGIAGIGFGFAFIFIDQAVKQSVLGPLITAKLMSVLVLISILKIFRMGAMPKIHKYPIVCLTGLFDAAGTAFYASAAHVGRLDISAVLASMHPGITAFLAWVILRERLSRRQWFGVVAALISLALIAT
jgi:drug/metabolite transporter (DMT)-like permease